MLIYEIRRISAMNRIICLGIFIGIGLHRILSCLPGFTVLALSTSNHHRKDTVAGLKMMPERRNLPEKILVGYATRCSEKVMQSVREGVNVVIWSFVEMTVAADDEATSGVKGAKCISTFDLFCAKEMISQLDREGYDDTVHLVSFGGWNGPHLPNELSAENMYNAWKELIGETFHGVDWDLEGHDRLDNPTNVFSTDCLENMGRFSELAKQDGFIVGMAPPQSYLDIEESRFTRYVNLTDPSRGWHDDFHYFGHNAYAYLLSKYGDSIDFVSVQFYESYSRAGLEVFHNNVAPATYLQNYVKDLVANKAESFFVDFDQDPSLNHSSRMVPFPLSKLVFGFANGWGANDDEKVCYFDPEEIAIAYNALKNSNQAPRGFMFWVM
jgi:chitinase